MLIPFFIIYVTCLALTALSKSEVVRKGAYIAVLVMHILVSIIPTCFWVSEHGVLLGLAMGAGVLGISMLFVQGVRFVIREVARALTEPSD